MSNRGAIWMGLVSNSQLPNVQQFAVDTARTIEIRPSWITISRDKGDGDFVQLEPQKVRLEVVQSIRDSGENRDAMVAISKQYVVIMGYKQHPTIPDTDLQRGDQFFFQNRMYEIQEIIDTLPGRLMASGDLTP